MGNRFAERLRSTLENKSISQYRFAKMLELPFTTLNSWVIGKHEPDIDMIVKIALALNVTTDYLFGITD
jgi:transcriptional regulator with XRE-family HTH domain